MLKLSIFAALLLIATVAGIIDLYYNTHARTAPGYCLVGLAGVGLVMMVVLMATRHKRQIKHALLIWHCKLLIKNGNGVLAFGYQNMMVKLFNRTYYLTDKECLGYRYLRRKGYLSYSKYTYKIVSPHSGAHHFNDDYYTILK